MGHGCLVETSQRSVVSLIVMIQSGDGYMIGLNVRVGGLVGSHGNVIKPQVNAPHDRPGELVGNKFVLASHVLDICRELWYCGKLMLLPTRPRLLRIGHAK